MLLLIGCLLGFVCGDWFSYLGSLGGLGLFCSVRSWCGAALDFQLLALGIPVLWIWFNCLVVSCLLIDGWDLVCLDVNDW